jgi:membrane protease YdiL (CAAX protease family)
VKTDLQSPQATRNPWSQWIAWIAIIGVVAIVTYRNNHANPNPANRVSSAAWMSKLRAQIALGTSFLQTSLGQPMTARQRDAADRVIHAMETDAHTPEDRLNLGIIAGEIQSGQEAILRLDALSKTQSSPELDNDIADLRTIYTRGPSELDSTARDRLIRRHDFFAQVALAYGAPAGADARKAIERPVMRTVVVLGSIGLFLFFVLLASLGLFIAAIILATKGKIQRAYIPDATANSAFLEAFALYLILFGVVFGWILRRLGLLDLNWEWAAWLIIPLAMSYVAWRGATDVERQKAFGWYIGRGWLREIGAGLVGYIAGLIVIAPGFLVTLGLVRWAHAAPEHPIVHELLSGSAWRVAAIYGLACVFAPVLEETMFRGALFHHLRRRWPWVASAPVTALIFAMLHPQGWVTVPALASIAIVLAGLREWRGTIIAPMAAHALNNFLALTLAVALLR